MKASAWRPLRFRFHIKPQPDQSIAQDQGAIIRSMIVDCAVYEAGARRDGNLALDHAFEASREKGAFVWIGLYEPTEEEFDAVRREFARAAIIAVPTAIAGIYGMNFDNMPELAWTFGYPVVLGVITVVCVSLYLYFRRIGWL